MFNFGFDPEKYASLGSSFDEPDPFTPTPVASQTFVPTSVAPVAPKPVAASIPKPVPVSQPLPSFRLTDSNTYGTQHGFQKTPELLYAESLLANLDPEALREQMGGFNIGPLGSGITPEYLETIGPAMQDRSLAALGLTREEVDPTIFQDVNSFLEFDKGATQEQQEAQLGNLQSLAAEDPTQFGATWPTLKKQDQLRYIDKLGLDKDESLNTMAQALNTHASNLNPKTKEPYRKYVVAEGKVWDTGGWGNKTFFWTTADVPNQVAGQDFKSGGMLDFVLNNPVTNIAASVIPFGQVALTAAKAANGQTLHGMDYLGASLSAAKGLGMLQAPVSANEARKVGEAAAQSGTTMAGPIAENAALAGKGLTIAGKTLTYNQSVGLLSAAATGDPKSALVSIYGGDLVKGGLERAGISSEVLAKVGIPADAFESGLQKTIEKVAAGEELDEALAYGFVDYAKEGGLKNLLDRPESDISFGGIEDVVRDIVRPIGSAATALAKAVENSIPDIDTSALDPLENAIREVGRTTEDVVRAGGSAVDDAIIQPVREIAKDLDDAVFQPVGDALSAADTALRDAMPDINLPSIDLPNIDLPNFNLPSLGMGMGMLLSGSPAPTATTGKLFENELFKFKNKIELTEFGPLNQPEQEVDIEEFLTSPFESAFTTTQRFA